jgi:hypothetical protein
VFTQVARFVAFRGTLARPVALGAAVASALLGVGCSSSASSPGLTLSSQRTGACYSQAFEVGVADVRDSGETDVVVTCRTEPAGGAGDNAGAAAAPAVTQVLHVRMLWQQGYRVKAAMREVSQNAAFHWYVYPAGRANAAGSAAGGPQVVEYTGTGLVEMTRDGDQVTLRVAEAKLTPTTVTPGMADPVGPATLDGTLVARTDRRQTAALLDGVRATVAAARPTDGVPTGASAVQAKVSLGQ